MKIKRSLSMVLAAALALCCVSLNAFAADRDEIQTLDLSDVKIVESTDWAEPVALPRSGLGGAFIELSVIGQVLSPNIHISAWKFRMR